MSQPLPLRSLTVAHADPGGPLANVLNRLEKVKRNGAGWVARCPAHEDRNPSLSITQGDDGRVLLRCHAGCQFEAIVAAIQLRSADLFEPQPEKPAIVATYDYVDENGDMLYQAVRLLPKSFRQRRPDGSGGWTWSLGNTRRVLYRLPKVLEAAERGDTVYVCEGEKDVHAIEKAGATATTNAMGAGKWRDDYAASLIGAQVVIVTDNDDTGRAHANTVLASLERAGIEARIVVPAAGKDAHDHLASGHTLDELVPLLPTAIIGPWSRIDLADPQYAIPPAPPDLFHFLYSGKRHVISGAPESAKTLIAYASLIHIIDIGHNVAIIDFEMGPVAARRLLDDLGATSDHLNAIYYVAPDSEPEDSFAGILAHQPRIVLVDAAVGAYEASGLDDNARKDAETFARTWIRPLWEAEIATLLIDHVTKNTETRGKFTIGSERKVGQADVHLGLEAVQAVTRGGQGLVKVRVHKDRPGFLQRPTAALIELASDPTTHRITAVVKPPEGADAETGHLRPTVLMERVSMYLETQPDPVSRSNVETNVKGNSAAWIRIALDQLVKEGYATETEGSRNARLYTSKSPYRKQTDPKNTTSSDLVRPRPDEVTSPRPTPSPPQGDGGRGDGLQTTLPRLDELAFTDDDDPYEVAALTNLYSPGELE